MYILGVETSGLYTSVALADEMGIQYFFISYRRFAHAEDINLLVEKILEIAELPFEKIDSLVVSLGPGFFTSLRVGISFAKALAFTYGLKIYGLITLDVLAHKNNAEKVVSTLPAQKGEVFWAAYEKGKRITDYGIAKLEDIRKKYPDFRVMEPVNYPDAQDLLNYFLNFKDELSEMNSEELEPFYLRLPDAYLKNRPA